MPTLNELLKQITQAERQANQANEQRLRRIVGQFNPETQQYEGGLFGSFGQDAATRAEMSAERQFAQREQDLIDRGLGNTTIRSSVRRGIQEDKLRNLADIEERVARARAGVVEGVFDEGPDMGLVAQLAQQAESAPDTPRTVTVPGARSPSSPIQPFGPQLNTAARGGTGGSIGRGTGGGTGGGGNRAQLISLGKANDPAPSFKESAADVTGQFRKQLAQQAKKKKKHTGVPLRSAKNKSLSPLEQMVGIDL